MGAQCRALRNLELNLSLDAEFPEPRAVSFMVNLFGSGEAWFAGVVRDGRMRGRSNRPCSKSWTPTSVR